MIASSCPWRNEEWPKYFWSVAQSDCSRFVLVLILAEGGAPNPSAGVGAEADAAVAALHVLKPAPALEKLLELYGFKEALAPALDKLLELYGFKEALLPLPVLPYGFIGGAAAAAAATTLAFLASGGCSPPPRAEATAASGSKADQSMPSSAKGSLLLIVSPFK